MTVTLEGGPLDGQRVTWPAGALIVCFAARRVDGQWQLCEPREAECHHWVARSAEAVRQARRNGLMLDFDQLIEATRQ